MYREKKISKWWFHFGTIRGFWLGIQIDRAGFELNIGFFYVGMERII